MTVCVLKKLRFDPKFLSYQNQLLMIQEIIEVKIECGEKSCNKVKPIALTRWI